MTHAFLSSVRRFVPLGLGLAILASSTASAQFPPERLTNVKAFPAEIPVRALIDSMQGFTRALGVRCTYCHVGQEGQPLASYDFASDEKPAKVKAREMIRMVGAINGEHLAKLVSRREPSIGVTCATCHRGVTEPRTLQQVILAAYDAAGADSAEALYRALRQRYHGRSAYDFGEVALADVATAMRRRNRLPDAVRFHRLNTEFSPTSGFAFRMAADAQLASGDTTAAKTSLERALAIDPNDQQAKRVMDALTRRP
jgi:hypothetical protein